MKRVPCGVFAIRRLTDRELGGSIGRLRIIRIDAEGPMRRHHRAFDQPVDAAHRRGDLQGRVAHGIGGQLSPAEDAVGVLDLVPVALTVGAERCAVQINSYPG